MWASERQLYSLPLLPTPLPTTRKGREWGGRRNVFFSTLDQLANGATSVAFQSGLVSQRASQEVCSSPERLQRGPPALCDGCPVIPQGDSWAPFLVLMVHAPAGP
jgi:hypothetical protein